jgi:hypothetical protein
MTNHANSPENQPGEVGEIYTFWTTVTTPPTLCIACANGEHEVPLFANFATKGQCQLCECPCHGR